jgi:hypothetical protein
LRQSGIRHNPLDIVLDDAQKANETTGSQSGSTLRQNLPAGEKETYHVDDKVNKNMALRMLHQRHDRRPLSKYRSSCRS